MSTTVRQIKDAFPNSFVGNGLFSAFNNPVWKDNFTASDLDILFITRYGERLESPFIEHFDTGNGVSENDLTVVARTIYSVFASQWEHLWKANIAQYNPIENTDAFISITDTHETSANGTENRTTAGSTSGTTGGKTETDTDNTTTGTGTVTHAIDETETVKGTGTVTHSIDEKTTAITNGNSSGTDNGENNVFGFNSASAVGSDASTGTTTATAKSDSSGTRTETDTEMRDTTDAKTNTTTDTETRNTTDKLTGKQTTTESGTNSTTANETVEAKTTATGTGTDTHEEHRHGNIGVTTNAQMIQGEIDIWKWSFIDTVMNDICKLIALSVY